MRIPGLIAGLIAFGLTLNSTGFASDDALVLLNGESSNSAFALHGLLSGAEVETHGSLKSITLDSQKGMNLSCDSERGECTLSHSGFIQTQSYDLDQLMIITGSAATKLFDAISDPTKSATRLNVTLGTSGRYGTDILDCKKEKTTAECQLFRSYCYYPGC